MVAEEESKLKQDLKAHLLLDEKKMCLIPLFIVYDEQQLSNTIASSIYV